MPYEISRSGCPSGKPFAVRKKGGGDVIGCHASEASAKRQMAALYANEKSHVKTAIKRENGIDFPPRDYAYVPDPLLPSTWKLRLTESPGKISEAQLRRAAAALSPKGFRGNRVDIPASALNSVKRRVRAEFRRLGVAENDIPLSVKGKDKEQDFFVFKDAKTGSMRWFAIYSNNFRDNDNPPETIAEKSHLNFVDMVDSGLVDYPELWLWHTKGTAWGKADWVAYVNGFAMASGLVYPGCEFIAKNLVRRGNLQVSHGMPKNLVVYDSKDKSTIVFHVTAEISPLPDWAAANHLTGFAILDDGEYLMGKANNKFPPEKRQYLKEAGFDDETIDRIESNLEKASSAATNAGIVSKDASVDEGDSEIVDFDTSDLGEDDDTSEADADEVEDTETEPVVQKATSETKAADSAPAKKPRKKKADTMVKETADFASKTEIAEAIGAVLSPLVERMDGLAARVESLTKEVSQLQRADEEKIALTKELTPSLSLAELISQNVIGNSKAVVKAKSDLADEGPVETKAKNPTHRTPVPFVNEMIEANAQHPTVA